MVKKNIKKTNKSIFLIGLFMLAISAGLGLLSLIGYEGAKNSEISVVASTAAAGLSAMNLSGVFE